MTFLKIEGTSTIVCAYTDIPWSKTCDQYGFIGKGKHNSFILKIENDSIIKLPHNQKFQAETFHFNDQLMSFGCDLDLCEDCNLNNKNTSNIGNYYLSPDDIVPNSKEAKEFLTGNTDFMI